MKNVQSILTFVEEAERLKTVLRTAWLSDGQSEEKSDWKTAGST